MSTTSAPLGLRERKKLEVERTIRRAALELFATDGYDAVSVEAIAAAANVSRTTFFNYFASKEAVVTEPDSDALERQRRLCAARPADEPLWSAVSGVIVEGIRESGPSILVLKQLKAASPAAAVLVQRSSERSLGHLREWVLERATDAERDTAALLIAVAVAATATAFEAWEPGAPVEALAALARRHLDVVGVAFA